MGGNFHDDVLHAALRHVGKHLVQEYGVGRREGRVYLAVGVTDAERPHDAARLPRLREDGSEHICGGRLSVRARNADDLQLSFGMAVERGGEFSRSRPSVRNDDLRHGYIQFALAGERGSPGGDRLRGKVVPVVFPTPETDEKIAVHDVLAVRTDALYLPLRKAGRPLVCDLSCEFSELQVAVLLYAKGLMPFASMIASNTSFAAGAATTLP